MVMNMKKAEFFLQIITPLAMLISAVWFTANLDKQISLAQREISAMKQDIKSFESRQERLNLRQDQQIESYRKYYDEKLSMLLSNSQRGYKNVTNRY